MSPKNIIIPPSVKSCFLQPLLHQMLGFAPQTVQTLSLQWTGWMFISQEPISWASKIMKTVPNDTHNHQKWNLKSSEFQLLWRVGFCDPSHTKCLFSKPQTSRFSSKDRQKEWPGNKHGKKHIFLWKVAKQLSKWAPEIGPGSPGRQSEATTHSKWQVCVPRMPRSACNNAKKLQP